VYFSQHKKSKELFTHNHLLRIEACSISFSSQNISIILTLGIFLATKDSAVTKILACHQFVAVAAVCPTIWFTQ